MKSNLTRCKFLLALFGLVGSLSIAAPLSADTAAAPAAPAQAAGASGTVVLNAKEYGDANPSAKITDAGDPGASLTGNSSDVTVVPRGKIGNSVPDRQSDCAIR